MQNAHHETTVDQKLELIRQVRSQYRQNQNDLIHRESILYDRPIRPIANLDVSPAADNAYYDPYNIQKKGSQTSGTLKIRFVTAVLLTALVILFHRSHISPAGIHMEQVFLALEQDYEDLIMAWSSSLISTEQY